MLDLRHRFVQLQEELPGNSSLIYFMRLMVEQGVNDKRTLGRYFDVFVEMDDYIGVQKEVLKTSLCQSLKNKGFLGVRNNEFAPGRTKSADPIPTPYPPYFHA